MNSWQKSQLVKNLSRLNLDSRISKYDLNVRGRGRRFGERISLKPGFSPEIMDYRPFMAGDPVKDIDWKLTAKSDRLTVKIREGYRQADILVLIDYSPSMYVSYKESFPNKNIAALSMAYFIVRLFMRSRDRVNLYWGKDLQRIDNEAKLLNVLVSMENYKAKDLSIDQSYNNGEWQGEFFSASNIFVISDFFWRPSFFHDFINNNIQARDNLVFCCVQDEKEKYLDFTGAMHYFDTESTDNILINNQDIQHEYQMRYNEHFRNLAHQCHNHGAKFFAMAANDDPIDSFVRSLH